MSEKIKKKLGADNFSNPKKAVLSIAFTAIFIALFFVLDRFLGFYPTDSMKISFSFLAVAVCSVYFGPVAGMLTGGLGDLLGALLIPRGAPNLLLTMTAALGGLVYGLLLYSPEGYEFTKKQLIVRVIAANLIISLVLNLTMNTFSIALMYGGDNVLGYALASFPARAVKESIMFVIRSLCLIAITLPEGRVKKIFSSRS